MRQLTIKNNGIRAMCKTAPVCAVQCVTPVIFLIFNRFFTLRLSFPVFRFLVCRFRLTVFCFSVFGLPLPVDRFLFFDFRSAVFGLTFSVYRFYCNLLLRFFVGIHAVGSLINSVTGIVEGIAHCFFCIGNSITDVVAYVRAC